MGDRSIEQSLRRLLEAQAVSAYVGLVTAVASDPDFGLLLTVELEPDRWVVQVRYAGLASGGGPGAGFLWPVEAGDEVLVLLPDTDQNQGVALSGLYSRPAPMSSSFDNDRPELVHPSGLTVRAAPGTPVEAVVREGLLPDLQASLLELSAALKGFGIPTPNTDSLVAQLAAAYRGNVDTDGT